MKHIYNMLLLFVCSSFAGKTDYPVARLYAYQQTVSTGANAASDKRNKSIKQEYIYLALKQNRTIQIEQVWINGAAVNFTTAEVKSPVTIEAGVNLAAKNATQVLVPETAHTVVQVLIGYTTSVEVKAIPKRYKNYPLLIQYREGASVFFLGTQNWKITAPKVNQ